ncbi:hypothetical protein BRARA_J00354 [Brassica rapa]|uniref:Uncharacterized protein n=1 Tax=Brassica campestris TaxID=3711 RepID=A0A397XI84_BRACM|nr:hypothetical protein BRARA_J00354 [Brassica rapa]
MNSSLMGSFCLYVSLPIYIGSFLKGFNTLKISRTMNPNIKTFYGTAP